MINKGSSINWLKFISVLLAALPLSGFAQDWSGLVRNLQPYVKAGAGYDSNLFRISGSTPTTIDLNGTTINTTKTLSDNFWTIEAGLDGELQINQQSIIIAGNLFRNLYDTYDDNNYTGADGNVTWNWVLGDRWDGELGYLYSRNLQDYANQGGSTLVNSRTKNIRTRQSVVGRANFDVTRNWRVYARGKLTDVTFSAETIANEKLDTDRAIAGGGIDFTSRFGNRVGLDFEAVKGNYTELTQFDYDEYSIKPTVNWEISEKSRIRGRLGYTSRDYKSDIEPDFDGFTGRLTLVRNPEEPTTWQADIYREISTLNDDEANYALIDGVSIAPTWAIGGKTVLNLFASYEQRDFQGGGQRQDNVATGSIFADWEAINLFTLSAGVTAQDRSSNVDRFDYSDVMAELRLRAGF